VGDAGDPSLCGAGDRDGADAVDSPERNYSFLTQVEAILLDGHFVLSMEAAAELVCSLILMDAGMWRRETITTAGGGSMTP